MTLIETKNPYRPNIINSSYVPRMFSGTRRKKLLNIIPSKILHSSNLLLHCLIMEWNETKSEFNCKL